MIPNALVRDVDYPVFQFCKKHNIKCLWDFDRYGKWTEILVGETVVFQVQHTTTVKQFMETIRLFSNNYKNEAIKDIEGDRFWVWVGDEELFNKFINEHGGIFGISVNYP